ncbi:phosphate acetyltransferase [Urechidicola vernalis]|uniref:Phosphate acetyltransferase n=1 Tax=Urechidicola vernalis TaxID=3075600 RepID=A0ABU2Y1J2_9FLAO|nr:phosphate acetyltransferase [Urechidicola sp. P050]MDT0551640.1 phosphate acetyltransferase [Urechidicola sp. P050]
MNKAVYIATSEPSSGKSIVALGLMKLVTSRTPKVGYFRPIIDDIKEGQKDNHLNTVISHFDLDINHEEAYGFMRSEFVKKKNQGKEGEIIDTIIDKYKKLESKYDFLIVEGTDFSGEGTAIELDSNILIAKNLGIPAIIVSSGIGKNMDEFIGDLHIAYDSFKERDVEVLSVVANKISTQNVELVKTGMPKYFPEDVLINVIPLIESLKNPSIKEIATAINGSFLLGNEEKNNQVATVKVGAMQLRNYLTRLEENCLIITPGDRADIILGALQANLSSNYPTVAGMVLTGGLVPEEPILKLIEGLSQIVPILSVKEGTFEVTNKIGAIESHIYADNKRKIVSSIETFEKNVNVDALANKLIQFKSESITPRMFQYHLQQKAKVTKKHIVLPEGNDARILKAAAQLSATNIVGLTLLGDESVIRPLAEKLNLELNDIAIINPIESEHFESYAQTFYELRKHKNVTIQMARDIMTDVSYFGTMMVYNNHADGMVSGAAHTTQHTIRPALQFIKTKPNVSVVSSVFFMCLEDRISVFGDCAINPNPNAQQLAEIAISSADSSKAFGIDPKIAMLSYSSGSSGKGADVDKVREATEIVKQKRPDLKIEGPIQYDAAVDMNIGKSKLPDSEVAGQASVLIFPDLNTGNNTYKAVQRETGALAIGPMLQGLNKPVNDLSRGCTVEDIYNTVILTAIQSQDF